jgi:transcriptional regulator with XRE-family HTH domain
MAMVAIQKKTVPPLRLVELRHDIDISQERMARLFDVSAKTIARWEAKQTLPDNVRVRSLLAQLQEIRDLGRIVYGVDGFHEFLRTPFPVFEGKTGLQMIEQGHADDVFAAIASDYEGLGF